MAEGDRTETIRPTDDEARRLARDLMRSARYGALATLDPGGAGPVASRVATATLIDGTPVILVSRLAQHTAGLDADPRCSLLLGEPGKGDPLAHPRITLHCRALRLAPGTPEMIEAARRYLNRQPKARLYAGFTDFGYFRLDPQSASLNGGFGRAFLLGRDDLLVDHGCNDALREAEQGALDHMNADHRDAIALYATRLAGKDKADWRLSGIDSEGLDLVAGENAVRLRFPRPLQSAQELRTVLVGLARAAREEM